MNTYEENLKSTAMATLAALAAEQDRLDSAQTAEHYKLYYAQGAQLTALDKVGATRHTLKSVSAINTQCLSNDNAAVNLLATATTAKATVATSNTNMATAASNVQIASNAIAMVAAEIGAALNGATASLYKTNVYNKLQDANALINEVANESKRISDMAMMASSYTSEIIAGPVLAQATAFKGKVDGLLKATQAEFDKFNGLFVSEKAAVGQASIAERQAEGAVRDADCEAEAIDTAYQNANSQLNVGLSVSVDSANVSGTQPSCTVKVEFSALSAPSFYSAPGDLTIPAMVSPSQSPYFVALVPESKMATLTTDLAEQLFNARKDGDSQFQPISATGAKLTFTTDVFQNSIVPGQPYVAFLYAVLSSEYKFFINNYSDWLSAPSARFIVAETLPTALNIVAKTPTPANPARPLFVQFYAAPFQAMDNSLEYRCILVEEDANDFELGLLRITPASIFFDLEIALQVAPANYETPLPAPAGDSDDAQPDTGTAAGPVELGSVQANTTIDFNSCSTDNYGNMLRAGATYRPYVLATVTSACADAYVSTLAYGDPVVL